MKRAFFLILALAILAGAQDKPLTQAEYVKMLYGLEKNPSGKAQVVEALRKRGVDFTVTDGIRGLTRARGSRSPPRKPGCCQIAVKQRVGRAAGKRDKKDARGCR